MVRRTGGVRGSALLATLLLVALSGCTGGASSSTSSTASSSGASPSAGPSVDTAAAVQALVRQYLPWRPPAVASVDGTVTALSGTVSRPAPARLEILQVQGTPSSTVLRMRLTSAAPVQLQANSRFSRGLKINIDVAGVRLDVPPSGFSTWPDLFAPGAGRTPTICTCSLIPADLDRDGVQLSATFPPLPQGTSSVVVRLPGFSAVTVPFPAGAGASPPSATADGGIPVLGGTSVAASRSAAGTEATVLVHGVRRIPGGTVVYYSVGAPQGQRLQAFTLNQFYAWHALLRDPTRQDGVRLVDHQHGKVYDTLVAKAGGPALATPQRPLYTTEPGRFAVVYQVLPPLPADVTTVDLMVGHGDVVAGLPVQDGVMTPEVDQGDTPLALGSGWPRIDLEAVKAAYQPAESVYALQSTVSTTDDSVTKRRQPGRVQVDLSADVLFAVDSATLTPAAASRLRAAADDLDSQAKAGVVEIVGHTDDTGSGPYNDQLSLDRARAVEKALRPLLTRSGLTFDVSGEGELGPVADNRTAEGRRANRRVTISFAPAAS